MLYSRTLPASHLHWLELVEFFDNAIFVSAFSPLDKVLELVEFFDNAIFLVQKADCNEVLELVEFFDNAILS